MKLRKVKTSICFFTNSNICEMINNTSIDKLFVNFLDLDDNERLCAMEPRLRSRRFASYRRGGGGGIRKAVCNGILFTIEKVPALSGFRVRDR